MTPMQAETNDRALVKTTTPGIYKRGSRYVVRYRDPNGKQRKRFARTLAEARDLKATLTADVAARRVPGSSPASRSPSTRPTGSRATRAAPHAACATRPGATTPASSASTPTRSSRSTRRAARSRSSVGCGSPRSSRAT